MSKPLFLRPLLLSVLLIGCAGVHKSGFLQDYNKLQKGDYLEKVRFSEQFDLRENAPILIQEPRTEKLSPNKALPPEMAKDKLAGMYEDWFNQLTQLKIGPKTQENQADYMLVSAITDLKPGSALMRWFAGEFGAGHSKVQVEGYIQNVKTGETIFEFADRRAGSAHGGMDITGGNSGDLLETDLDNIAKSVVKTLQSRIQQARAI